MNMTSENIARATGATVAAGKLYCEALNTAMERFGISTPPVVSAFLATVAIESARLSSVEEGLYYKDPARLADLYKRVFKSPADAAPYARNPKGLSDLLYKGFHGRGLIQLTWEKNYLAAGEALGYDYVTRPELVLQPKHAALTAAWFWSTNGCSAAAERGDMDDVTRRVNGPRKLHLVERVAQFNANMEWIPTC